MSSIALEQVGVTQPPFVQLPQGQAITSVGEAVLDGLGVEARGLAPVTTADRLVAFPAKLFGNQSRQIERHRLPRVVAYGQQVEGFRREQGAVDVDLDAVLGQDFGLELGVVGDQLGVFPRRQVDARLEHQRQLAGGIGQAAEHGPAVFVGDLERARLAVVRTGELGELRFGRFAGVTLGAARRRRDFGFDLVVWVWPCLEIYGGSSGRRQDRADHLDREVAFEPAESVRGVHGSPYPEVEIQDFSHFLPLT